MNRETRREMFHVKRSKDEILQSIREHGGESPDDFVVNLLADVADSFDDGTTAAAQIAALNTTIGEMTAAKDALQVAYDALKRDYADRFTIGTTGDPADTHKDEPTKEDKEREAAEAIDPCLSIFD